MRYHFTPIRMVGTSKADNNECWWGGGEMGPFHTLLVWIKNGKLWKPVSKFLKKLNIKLPNDPAIPLLDVYARKSKTYAYTMTGREIFIAE